MKPLLAIMVMVMAASCGVGRPPDAVALSLYVRNLSPHPYGFTVVDSHSPAWTGETGSGEPRSYGCGWAGRDWQLIVTDGAPRPGPAHDVATASGDDYGDNDELSIWIDVQPDGEVTIGDGVPAWWAHEKQRCL